MTDFKCPYCEEELSMPDYYGVKQEEMSEATCGECGKTFAYSWSSGITFHTQPAPCLNGGEHDWHKTFGLPKECFQNRYHCVFCGKDEVRRD